MGGRRQQAEYLTDLGLEPETLVRLSEDPNIIGLKQSVDFRSPGKHREDTREVITRAGEGTKIVVRTLDAGADKPLAFLNDAPEENPALGLRGTIRTSYAGRDQRSGWRPTTHRQRQRMTGYPRGGPGLTHSEGQAGSRQLQRRFGEALPVARDRARPALVVGEVHDLVRGMRAVIRVGEAEQHDPNIVAGWARRCCRVVCGRGSGHFGGNWRLPMCAV